MNILIIHNRYAIPGRGSGEEVSLKNIETLLVKKGHKVSLFSKSSLEISGLRGRLYAFFFGIYNPFVKKSLLKQIVNNRPDIVLVQNLYPLISPSILPAIKKLNIPILMRCPNYRLICPNGLMLSHGEICEKCLNGNDFWCLLKNCENNLFKSLGYALRNFISRRFSLYKKNIDNFLVLTEFARKKMISAGFDGKKIDVIYSMSDLPSNPPDLTKNTGSYVAFVGRLSEEKGILEIIETARECPEIHFKLAGSYNNSSIFLKNLPNNINLLGHLDSKDLSSFYSKARFIVIPSKCYEGLPVVSIESMFYGKPILCSNLGGLSEIVKNRYNGLLFNPYSKGDLTKKMRYLWHNPDICQKFSKNSQLLFKNFTPDLFYLRLMSIFKNFTKI